MKKTELTEVPERRSRSKAANIWPEVSDGGVWELNEVDSDELGYKTLESLRASLQHMAEKEKRSIHLTQREGTLYVQVES